MDRLQDAVRRQAQALARRERQIAKRERELDALRDRLAREAREQRFVTRSRAMHDVLALAAQVAPLDTTVLVYGESGTGKEFVVRMIHRQSRRAAGPFVSVNCAALTETLLESELFGHVRGAFTGAVRDKAGLFEVASDGTLFLDEIGEVAPAVQAKLLRALQEREIRRVGGERTLKVRTPGGRGHQPRPARRRSPPGHSARTSTSASAPSSSPSRRCATAARTSRRWPTSSCGVPQPASARTSARCPARR